MTTCVGHLQLQVTQRRRKGELTPSARQSRSMCGIIPDGPTPFHRLPPHRCLLPFNCHTHARNSNTIVEEAMQLKLHGAVMCVYKQRTCNGHTGVRTIVSPAVPFWAEYRRRIMMGSKPPEWKSELMGSPALVAEKGPGLGDAIEVPTVK